MGRIGPTLLLLLSFLAGAGCGDTRRDSLDRNRPGDGPSAGDSGAPPTGRDAEGSDAHPSTDLAELDAGAGDSAAVDAVRDAAGNVDAASDDAARDDAAGGDAAGSDSAGHDAVADGGAADGAGSDAGTVAGPCPQAVNYVSVGQTWMTSSNAAYEAEYQIRWSSRSEIQRIDNLGTRTEFTLQYTQDFVGSDYVSQTTGSWIYVCDRDGLKIARARWESTLTRGSTETRTTAEINYSPPLLMMIPSPQPGASWQGSSVVTTRGTSNGTPYDTSAPISFSASVLSPGNVTVPAGAFTNTIRVSWNWGSSADVQHYVVGVGMVASNTSELDSYSN